MPKPLCTYRSWNKDTHQYDTVPLTAMEITTEVGARCDGYGHVYLRFYVEGSSHDFYSAPWYKLQISCQLGGMDGDPKPYAFHVELRDQTLNCERPDDVTALAKTIAAMNKRYHALVEQLGRPQCFGQYVWWLCQALGVDTLYRAGQTYGMQTWHSGEIVETVNYEVRAVQRKLKGEDTL